MTQKLFERVVIVGPGLIGGSIGLGLKNRGIAGAVIGVGHRETSLARAVEVGAIDEGSLDIGRAVNGADFVVLATGVELMEKLAGEIVPLLCDDAILTDVGSTKVRICSAIEKLVSDRLAGKGGKVRYVGSHPLAGSEKRGIDAASEELFEEALCILTATEHTDVESLQKVKAMWHALGAKTLEISPEEHDRRLARVSHLVHLAAAGLVNIADEDSRSLAASGFLDTTRVASGDARLWKEICLSNREHLLAALGDYIASMNKFRQALENSSGEEIVGLLEEAKKSRDSILKRQKGRNSCTGESR